MRPDQPNDHMPFPYQAGDRIRPLAGFGRHGYRRGECYQVVEIDSDNRTLRAHDVNGRIGQWIRWCDCGLFDEIGWDWLKNHLSAEAVELLSAFDGVESLKLRPDLRIALVHRIPELKTRIPDVTRSREPHPQQP